MDMDMMNRINNALPRRPIENGEAGHPAAATITRTPTREQARIASVPRSLDDEGYGAMREKYGEKFALHYRAAFAAAGGLKGTAFLEQYRALKREAMARGMTKDEFRGFEKCLYRRFYRMATQDRVHRLQAGKEPKVQAFELAYIAKVGDIPADQLARDALLFKQSECVGRMKSILARNRNA